MKLPHPSAAVEAAVRSGAAWFKATAIYGYTWGGTRAEGRHLAKQEGAGPIWARYYSLATDTPIFGDRDKTIHDDVSEISLERRNGYAWYNGEGAAVLEHTGHGAASTAPGTEVPFGCLIPSERL